MDLFQCCGNQMCVIKRETGEVSRRVVERCICTISKTKKREVRREVVYWAIK
jgi:hypothetical protein